MIKEAVEPYLRHYRFYNGLQASGTYGADDILIQSMVENILKHINLAWIPNRIVLVFYRGENKFRIDHGPLILHFVLDGNKVKLISVQHLEGGAVYSWTAILQEFSHKQLLLTNTDHPEWM